MIRLAHTSLQCFSYFINMFYAHCHTLPLLPLLFLTFFAVHLPVTLGKP